MTTMLALDVPRRQAIVLANKSNDELWSETRIGVASRWESAKRSCQVLRILQERYLSNEKYGKNINARRRRFTSDCYREVGYSVSQVGVMIRLSTNKHLMYMENSVASKIDISAAYLLSQKKVMAMPKYKSILNKVKAIAIRRGAVVTLEMVKHLIYPRTTHRERFKAQSDRGRLLYFPKERGMTLRQVLRDILGMMANGGVAFTARKRRQTRVRRTT